MGYWWPRDSDLPTVTVNNCIHLIGFVNCFSIIYTPNRLVLTQKKVARIIYNFFYVKFVGPTVYTYSEEKAINDNCWRFFGYEMYTVILIIASFYHCTVDKFVIFFCLHSSLPDQIMSPSAYILP